jgi:hypothetical protein
VTQTFTQEHRAKLEEYLATHTLPKGLGTKESACSVAAINLAVSGTLTDDIPDCMSKVLGKATIRLQDVMPEELRNSERYKALLPEMAGTGREHEQERLDILNDWLWSVVLPQLQPLADKNGFGSEWQTMCKLKTVRAADAAAYAAADAARAAAGDYTAADAAAYVADTAAAAARATAAYATADAADTAATAARATAARADARDFWETVDPIGVLERMTYLNVETSK